MKSKKTTLKDIAAEAGVSLSTVHKALYDKPGISKRLKNEIIGIADSMGYKANFIASSLKRKPIRIAFLMPLPDPGPYRCYYQDIWKGLRYFKAAAAEYNVEVLEFGFSGPMETLPKKLKEIYENYGDEISGLITTAAEHPTFSYFIDRFLKKKIAVVFLSADLPKVDRLCCVRAQDTMAGQLAAELVQNFTGLKGRVVVAAGDILIASHYANISGFENYFSNETDHRMDILKVYDGGDQERLYRDLCRLLKSDPEITALYSCSARGTIPMCRAIAASLPPGRTVKAVGCGLFKESAEMLRKNVLQAVVFKDPFKMAYLSGQILFDYLVKNEFPESDTVFVTPVIVMKSNLSHYENSLSFNKFR